MDWMRGARRAALVARRATAAVVVVALAAAACSGGDRPVDSALGMKVGGGFFDGEAFVAAEEWLGQEIAWTVQFTGRRSQTDMNGSAFGLLADDSVDLPDFAERLSLSITVPLSFGSFNARTRTGRRLIAGGLSAVAAGEFDEAYGRVADRLIEAGYGDAVIRLGHEFNGEWAPWSSRTNEEAFIEAWRHVHGVFRAKSADFAFDWTAIRPAWIEWGRLAYPGDDYVDIVGLDVYWRVDRGSDAWDSAIWERDFLRVMRDHLAFAERHDKPVSYPEWGLSGADAPEFIEEMHEWLSNLETSGSGRLEYHAFFDSGGDFELTQVPLSRAAYRELFS